MYYNINIIIDKSFVDNIKNYHRDSTRLHAL